MRLSNKTLSLDLFLFSELTYVLSLSRINPLLAFSDIFKHLACQFETIVVFQIVLRSNFSSFEVKSTSHFAVNLLSMTTWALERRYTIFKHIIILFFRSWSFLPINIRNENRSRLLHLVVLFLVVLEVQHVIVWMVDFVSDVIVDLRIVNNNLQFSQSFQNVNNIKIFFHSFSNCVF